MTMEGIVKFCPTTKETWEARAKKGNCGGLNSYHCLSDNEDRKWQRCIEKALIKEGNCPIFTSKGFIDWKPCDMSMSTCPNTSYVSDEVYKYPGCFGNNSMFEESSEDYNKSEDMYIRTIIGIVLGIMFILVAVLIVVIVYMRRKMLNPETEGKVSEQLTLIEGGGSEEVVKKNYVKRGLSKLLKEEVRLIVVIGTFGNSVFTTSRRISEGFKNIENWAFGEFRHTDIPSWECLECRYTDIPNTVAENTILFVYGWFGMWNDDLCSVGRAETACKSLKRILDETNNVKVIVGIRSDLHKKYHKHLTILFRHKIYLDTTNCEHLRAFLKNIQDQCEENGCVCKNLKYEMFRKGKDKVVGIPLKLNVIQRYHELIPTYLSKLDILKVMQDHFTLIAGDVERKHVYEWVMYICLKGKFSRTDQFDTNLVEEMMFEIKQSSFNENDSTLQNYIRMRNSDKLKGESSEKAQYVFWHPFIYICAFHHLFEKDPKLLIQHCNVDAILQLVRPEGTKTSYFEVTANDRCVTLFNERIRQLGKEVEYARNPLVVTGKENAENEQLIQINMANLI